MFSASYTYEAGEKVSTRRTSAKKQVRVDVPLGFKVFESIVQDYQKILKQEQTKFRKVAGAPYDADEDFGDDGDDDDSDEEDDMAAIIQGENTHDGEEYKEESDSEDEGDYDDGLDEIVSGKKGKNNPFAAYDEFGFLLDNDDDEDDENVEDEEDPDWQKDPVAAINLSQYLAEFLKASYAANQGLFTTMAGRLTPAQQTLLKELLQ